MKTWHSPKTAASKSINATSTRFKPKYLKHGQILTANACAELPLKSSRAVNEHLRAEFNPGKVTILKSCYLFMSMC